MTISNNRRKLIALAEAQNWRCCWCNEVCEVPSEDVPLDRHATVEHVVPRSLRGNNNWDNLVMACHQCNNRRGSRITPELLEFMQQEFPFARKRSLKTRIKQNRQKSKTTARNCRPKNDRKMQKYISRAAKISTEFENGTGVQSIDDWILSIPQEYRSHVMETVT